MRLPLIVGAMQEATKSPIYEIRVRGIVGDGVMAAFPGLAAHPRAGVTVLIGSLPDQAALFGVLGQVESLGLELLAVARID